MGEKETAAEASAGRSSVQDFEKNTENRATRGDGAIDDSPEARGKAIIRNTNSPAGVRGGNVSADRSEHVYQHNQSDLDFLRTGEEPDADAGGGGDDAARLSTNMTIERQTPKRDFGD